MAPEEGAKSSSEGKAPPEEKPTWPVWIQLLAFVCAAAGNVGLNLFNSHALRAEEGVEPSWEHPSFQFPVFYTMFHSFVSALACLLLMSTFLRPPTGMPSFRQYWEYKDAVVPLAMCTFTNNSLNNMCLTMVSLFVNQVIKACSPVLTTLFSVKFAKKQYSIAIYIAVGATVIGSILANITNFTRTDGPTTSVTGVVICVIGMFCASLHPVLMMIIMTGTAERPKLHSTLVLFYDMSTTFCFMFLYWFFSNERPISLAYMSDPELRAIGTYVLSIGSSLAFEFNLSNNCFILVTSALTTAIAGNGIKIVLIMFSAILAGVNDVLSWTGITVVIVSVIVYAYLIRQEGPKPPQAAPPAADKPTKTA